MNHAIAHRGPDGDGIFHDEPNGVGLAHRRLAIIDLTESGHQPMVSEDGGTIITYNGEIYNYRELAAELRHLGWTFRGTSDTEVLLALFRQYGTEMLSKLNGIFSFAIWDQRRRELFVARDGVGVKPLYYCSLPQGVLFASELKALLQEQTLDTSLDPIAIARHLTFLWSPAPDTMIKSIKKLEPGCAFVVKDGKIARKWQYYDLPKTSPMNGVSIEESCQLVRTALDAAVKRQLVADVPVGAFLSGGLDSSSIVSMAQKHTGNRLQCFTIAFDDQQSSQDEGFVADWPYARKVADHLDVDLHTITVGSDIMDQLPAMIYHLDEPQADPAPLNAMFIAKLAREHDIKVLLSGAGGDDVLTGYRRHFALAQEKYWAWLPAPGRQLLSMMTRNLQSSSPSMRRLRKAFEYSGLDDDHRLASYLYWLSPVRTYQLLAPELREQFEVEEISRPLVDAARSLPPCASALQRMLYLEGKYFLADHNLNYTDKVAMAQGVEVRVPFLDPDFIAMAGNLPDGIKQRGTTGKWIFKKAMEGQLPHEIIYRPKTGFGAPLRRWLHNELRPMVEDLLSARSVAKRGVFDPTAVRQLIADDLAGRVDAAYTIFSLMCIELWCRIFIDQRMQSGSPGWMMPQHQTVH